MNMMWSGRSRNNLARPTTTLRAGFDVLDQKVSDRVLQMEGKAGTIRRSENTSSVEHTNMGDFGSMYVMPCSVVHLLSDKIDIHNGNSSSSDERYAACSTDICPKQERIEEYDVKYIQRLEQLALSSFRSSSWEDVIEAGLKILQVPGHSETNFNILYEVGYAYMRVEEYEIAFQYLMAAQRIDGQRVALRLALGELRRKVLTTGAWQKKNRKSRSAPTINKEEGVSSPL